MAQPRHRDPRFSYADYLQWSDDEPYELLDGVAYSMGPAPSTRHQEVLVALVAQVAGAVGDSGYRLYVAPFDVRLAAEDATDEEVDNVVQPDLAVVCDAGQIDARGCRGAPNWIVEVLSPRTALRDQVVKRDLYERHGVREYWIVDIERRALTIYRGDPWVRADAAARGLVEVEVLSGVTVDWDRVFAHILVD